jgi:hypothetical protein
MSPDWDQLFKLYGYASLGIRRRLTTVSLHIGSSRDA